MNKDIAARVTKKSDGAKAPSPTGVAVDAVPVGFESISTDAGIVDFETRLGQTVWQAASVATLLKSVQK